MGIKYELVKQEPLKLYNRQIEPYLGYPDSFDVIRKIVRDFFENYVCESCGSRRVEGYKVAVHWRPVELYKDVEVKGWFGLTNLETKLYKRVYEVTGIFLKPGGFLDPPGRITCLACGWKVEGERKNYIRWVSVNDIESAIRNLTK